MSDNGIEPQPVIDLVECYVDSERSDFERYTNRAPFDASGVWSLHQLARDVYALGVKDGATQEAHRNRGERQRAAAQAARIEADHA